ncbi:MAG: flagellar motor protein MotD [Chromatocurvus sp.]
MRRRRLPETTDNHERWLVSYADFITLLFAFFVVMYSISTVSNGSYRVLSDSIVSAFNNPRLSLAPVEVGEPVRSSVRMIEAVDEVSAAPVFIPFRPDIIRRDDDGGVSLGNGSLEEVAGVIEQRVADLIEDSMVAVRRSDDWVEIQIQATVLFPSGSRVLLSGAVPVLLNFVDILRRIPNAVNVEGYTDDRPISNAQFSSNWDLSASRAASVVRLFEANGIDPSRLSATGHGENHPIADNDTEQGRAANRRVVLVVMSDTTDGRRKAAYTVEVAAPGA